MKLLQAFVFYNDFISSVFCKKILGFFYFKYGVMQHGVVSLRKVHFNFDFNLHLKSTSLSLHTFFPWG